MFEQFDAALGIETEQTLSGMLSKSILSAGALKNLDIPERKKYLGPICEGTIGEIYGRRGIGKTQLRDAIALSITRGASLGPWQAGEPAGVLIVDGEMSLYDMKERQGLDGNVGEALRPLNYLSAEYLFDREHKTINLVDPKWRDAFIELLEANPQWQVIIFDNLSSFLPGTRENDSEAWGDINQFFLKIRWMKRASAFVHHTGKSGDQRGTSSREDQLDWVLKLSDLQNDPDTACRFTATLTKSRSLFGPETEPFIFELTGGLGEPPRWTITSKRQTQKEIIIALLGADVKQKDVAEMTGFDKGLVSRTKNKAIEDGTLSSGGNSLTAKGQHEYGHIDINRYLDS